MASNFNKDQALRSLEIAKRAAASGDKEKAEKFALKAKKLCDCDEVAEFLNRLHSEHLAGTSTQKASSRGPSVKQRQSVTRDQGTEEQRSLVAKIKKAKDFYQILDIAKDATQEDIKRAYKKLALKLHPDKNKALGAEEAFKAVSRAFSCLNDPEKRQRYDQYGSEEETQGMRHPSYHRREFYSDDIDPEFIFNMFFGGEFPMNGHQVYTTSFGPQSFRRRQRPSRQQANTSTQFNLSSLFGLLPIFLFILISFFSGGNDQVYSLSRVYPFDHEMITLRYEIPFYVKSKPKFDRAFPPGTYNRQQLELNIEVHAKNILQEQCREAKARKRRIHKWKGEEAAAKVDLQSCLELRNRFQTVKNRREARVTY